MINEKKYQEEVRSVLCGSKRVTVRNLTPVCAKEEKIKAKTRINQTLYEVFSKYG
ncbi:hypothetical protein [Caproiciproducens faecalis]|uniref:Uncharacterized protein n=1 Tax=Caproiciproducens faecalis TaxID=2820301 RepID=A0ABS7DLY9_9FIRM|nr:hypothetical protein [Caproiciproducens faecalis]MBW7572321.1 hypothetical protein [Caproiciproducens faecalis]